MTREEEIAAAVAAEREHIIAWLRRVHAGDKRFNLGVDLQTIADHMEYGLDHGREMTDADRAKMLSRWTDSNVAGAAS